MMRGKVICKKMNEVVIKIDVVDVADYIVMSYYN
jgi:hypothetical protein